MPTLLLTCSATLCIADQRASKIFNLDPISCAGKNADLDELYLDTVKLAASCAKDFSTLLDNFSIRGEEKENGLDIDSDRSSAANLAWKLLHAFGIPLEQTAVASVVG